MGKMAKDDFAGRSWGTEKNQRHATAVRLDSEMQFSHNRMASFRVSLGAKPV